MPYMMIFPQTVEEFMEAYKVVDTEHIYTNGTELVPIFRMKQWFEHIERRRIKEESMEDEKAADNITADDAKQAARTLRAYCNQKPLSCFGCSFHDRAWGCLFATTNMPADWKIHGDKKNKQGG